MVHGPLVFMYHFICSAYFGFKLSKSDRKKETWDRAHVYLFHQNQYMKVIKFSVAY